MSTVGVATGAGRGMGRACAERMVSTVDQLFLVDRDGPAVSLAAQELSVNGHNVSAVTLDVTDRVALAALASRVAEAGTLRAVVHAAGISPSMGDWREVLGIDLVGTALVVEALRPLATAGTAFVCYASMAAHMSPFQNPEAAAAIDDPLSPDMTEKLRAALGEEIEDSGSAYSWAKWGVTRLVRRESLQLGRAGARINSVSPGCIDTPMGRQEAEAHPSMGQLVEVSSLSRGGEARELAAATAFLLSDEASYITGTDVLVDGGTVAGVAAMANG